jgi:hypothetical protein
MVGLVTAVLVAAVAALLLPHPVVGDERDELDKARRRLGAVESVLRDARADAMVALETPPTRSAGRRGGWPSRSAGPT